MPIYEYSCEKCGTVTELLRKMSQADQPAPCAKCGSAKTKRKQSVFAASTPASAASPCGAPHSCSGPGCCGSGMCGIN